MALAVENRGACDFYVDSFTGINIDVGYVGFFDLSQRVWDIQEGDVEPGDIILAKLIDHPRFSLPLNSQLDFLSKSRPVSGFIDGVYLQRAINSLTWNNEIDHRWLTQLRECREHQYGECLEPNLLNIILHWRGDLGGIDYAQRFAKEYPVFKDILLEKMAA